MIIRNDRKKFIHQNGIENYYFDYDREIRIYMFLCGERLSKKEYKKLKDNEKMRTYAEWENYIRNKYTKYPVNALKEFSRYLNHRGRISSPEREFISPMASAIVSGMLSLFVAQSTKMMEVDFASVMLYITVILLVLLMDVVTGYFIAKISEMFFYNSIKENLFKDYREIIDAIIMEKV